MNVTSQFRPTHSPAHPNPSRRNHKLVFLASLSLLSLILTSCSSTKVNSSTSTPQNSSLKSQAQAKCTYSQKIAGLKVITGQLQAFKANNLNLAYTFASSHFRSQTSLDEFSAIIANSYPMLLNLKSFSVTTCLPLAQYLNYVVAIQDSAGDKFQFFYQLSQNAHKWGVEGVQIIG